MKIENFKYTIRDFEISPQIAQDIHIEPGSYKGYSKVKDDGFVVTLIELNDEDEIFIFLKIYISDTDSEISLR